MSGAQNDKAQWRIPPEWRRKMWGAYFGALFLMLCSWPVLQVSPPLAFVPFFMGVGVFVWINRKVKQLRQSSATSADPDHQSHP
jgi:hypothetical protein